MELLQDSPATAVAPWETRAALDGATISPQPAARSIIGVPLRCRFGLHRWLSLAMSGAGARHQLSLSFCRDCEAIRHPETR